MVVVYFAVCLFFLDDVAEVVVVIAVAVVVADAVVVCRPSDDFCHRCGGRSVCFDMVADVVRGVVGVAAPCCGHGLSQCVVTVLRAAATLVVAADEVAVLVVMVAASDGIGADFPAVGGSVRQYRPLLFQTACRVVPVTGRQPALRAPDFAVQCVALAIADGLAAEHEAVLVAAAVVMTAYPPSVGQVGGGTVTVAIVVVAYQFGM